MQETIELKLTAMQERELVRQLGWAEYREMAQIATETELAEMAEKYIAERKAKEERVVVTVLAPRVPPTPVHERLSELAKSPSPNAARGTGRIVQVEVITQDFDDLHETDEYHDVEKKQRLYLGSFNTKTKRVVFRTGDRKQIIGYAVTPNGNPIKSSESDGIYTDKANGAQWMYVDVVVDERDGK